LKVEPLYQAVNATLQKIADPYRWAFVVADNCSTDRTFECLEASLPKIPGFGPTK
jgi:hypothetical protein